MYTFDLQFRKDTRHDRTGSPTYYRWKAQLVVTLPKDSVKDLQKMQKVFGCGAISVAGNQARLSVQNIDEIYTGILPHFEKNSKLQTTNHKQREFKLWAKAVEIIYKNKGVKLTAWEKNDLKKLLEIHKLKAQYQDSKRKSKWLDMAQTLAK